jgi:hypothetical protein
MELVLKYVKGRVEQSSSVTYQSVDTAHVFSLNHGQEIIIDTTTAGLAARATIHSSFAAKLLMTPDNSFLQIKTTTIPVVYTLSLTEGYALVTANLLDCKVEDSGEFIGLLLLEVLLDAMLQPGKLPQPPPLCSLEWSIWCWGAR